MVNVINPQPGQLYLAGDCGAFSDASGGFVKVEYNGSTIICSGVGGGEGVDNVIHVDRYMNPMPILFDVNGNVIPHLCKSIIKGGGGSIEICGSIQFMNRY